MMLFCTSELPAATAARSIEHVAIREERPRRRALVVLARTIAPAVEAWWSSRGRRVTDRAAGGHPDTRPAAQVFGGRADESMIRQRKRSPGSIRDCGRGRRSAQSGVSPCRLLDVSSSSPPGPPRSPARPSSRPAGARRSRTSARSRPSLSHPSRSRPSAGWRCCRRRKVNLVGSEHAVSAPAVAAARRRDRALRGELGAERRRPRGAPDRRPWACDLRLRGRRRRGPRCDHGERGQWLILGPDGDGDEGVGGALGRSPPSP